MRLPPSIRVSASWVVLMAIGTGTMGAPDATQQKQASYLALGDSYTIGESVPQARRWPVQLVAQLRSEGIAVADPRIVARTGWTTDELSNAMDEADLVGPYAMVSLLIGVNNQYRQRSAEEYAGEFRRLLERSSALAGDQPDRVLVMNIPDWGVTPFGASDERGRQVIGQQIAAYNAVNRRISEAAGVHYVDVFDISRRAAGDVSLIADDSLHPSGTMYELWTRAALPAARDILKERTP